MTMTPSLLDAKGLKCPMPVIKARKMIKTLGAGSRLKIECTDPLAEIDIPHMVRTDGHTLLDQGQASGTLWYLIEIGHR